MLNRVTFTGVDDRTNVNDLVDLTKRFPFVEFGVLISKGNTNRSVVNRYPKLCDVVLRLKELQAYFIKNTFIENGILKVFPVSKIVEIPDNVKVICGDKEEKDLKEGRYGNDIFYNCFMNAKISSWS